MTVTVTGRVVDEGGTPLKNLIVEAVGDWFLTTERLGSTKIEDNGHFFLAVSGPIDTSNIPSSFRLRVIDFAKRAVTTDRDLSGTVASHDLGDLTVKRADAEGLLVTNLTGKAEMVSEGNAIKLLVDGVEAFGRVADDIRAARHSVNVVELFFDLPDEFHHSGRDEKAHLIFKFLPPPLVPSDPNKDNQPKAIPRGEALLQNGQLVTISDDRPERLLIDAAITDKTIRILLNEPGLGFPEGVFWLAVLTPLAAGLGVAGVAGLLALAGIGIPFFPVVLAVTVVGFFIEYIKVKLLLEDTTDVDEARKYFGAAKVDVAPPIVPRITIHGFPQKLPDHGVQHCKMVITDENRAVVIGSPFSQRYFDFPSHKIEGPHRGSNTADLLHDLSVGVVGPAVRDLYDTFRTYWNEDITENERLPESPVPAKETGGEDGISKVQVVRTRSKTRFDDRKKAGSSEKGILEGYLRAFAAAEHYIYLENQYFTDSGITEGLVEVLKAKPFLQLILVVPIKPDVITYPRRQGHRIEQLREAGGDRVGVFTRWSYDENHPRPWVAPVYIHAKGAVIDDSWATIGSANLDGLSLDYNLLLSPLVFGETTASELNVNMLPPSPGAIHPLAELLRRRLWAEHLGLLDDTTGDPNPQHPDLNHPPGFRWLELLWRPSAAAALEHVKAGKAQRLKGFVLEFPREDGGTLDTPRKHLAALGVKLKPFNEAPIRPLTGTRKFDFPTGKWAKDTEHEDIKL